ncbi:MAG TPA: PAS domain-containing protein, partial [Bacteroidales bacterium]|nr:PAS domain-containing protein [Bacteroidales bacterium]
MKAVNIQKRISELEHENNVLKQTIAGYEQKLSQKCSNEEFLKAESVNKDLELAKQELEQYKSHLEEVIKERTVELKNSEMRFLTLSDSLSGGAIFEITLTKEDIPWIGYMSKTTSSLLEFDLNLMRDNLGAFYERIYPDDLPIFNQAFTLSKETKCEFNVEVRFITPSNKIKWLHFKANAIEQTNNYTVWVGIIIDTTQKNIFQQEIQEREAILNAIIENIPYDFWARDAQLRCFLQ